MFAAHILSAVCGTCNFSSLVYPYDLGSLPAGRWPPIPELGIILGQMLRTLCTLSCCRVCAHSSGWYPLAARWKSGEPLPRPSNRGEGGG